eukprot:5733972-Pyramimonas_sp.AAC.1
MQSSRGAPRNTSQERWQPKVFIRVSRPLEILAQRTPRRARAPRHVDHLGALEDGDVALPPAQ